MAEVDLHLIFKKYFQLNDAHSIFIIGFEILIKFKHDPG